VKTVLFALIALFLASCSQKPSDVKLKTEEDKIFYSMGHMLGKNLEKLELNDSELAALYKGLSQASKGAASEVDVQEFQPKIQELFRNRIAKSSEKEVKKGKDFLENFKKEAGVVTTASGLAYKVITAGTGATPKADDTVEVHYHGTLLDGTVFDSSVERGQKITFPLNRVIKGWTEGLQLMKEGGKTKFVIPAELAYGDTGAPPKIPGGATLIFEVELFKIVKADAKPEAAPAKK
jgi:FKBP-type peptidyl-prolyl cis-trans isomerase FkpA